MFAYVYMCVYMRAREAPEDVSLSSAFPLVTPAEITARYRVKYCIIDDPGVRSEVRRIHGKRVRIGRLSHLCFNTP